MTVLEKIDDALIGFFNEQTRRIQEAERASLPTILKISATLSHAALAAAMIMACAFLG